VAVSLPVAVIHRREPTAMIERMAERGAQRLYLREAERLGHNHIGCEHLLQQRQRDA
jgi:hypothetical protein